jgi:hypothetical protein
MPGNLMWQSGHSWSLNGTSLEGVQLDEFSANLQDVKESAINEGSEEEKERVLQIIENEKLRFTRLFFTLQYV